MMGCADVEDSERKLEVGCYQFRFTNCCLIKPMIVWEKLLVQSMIIAVNAHIPRNESRNGPCGEYPDE